MYREEQVRNLLVGRDFIKPFLYPEVQMFKEGIRHAYWIHTEFNYDPDVQDYRTNTTPPEKTLFTRAVLGVSQIEVKVKDFWAKIKDMFPHYEIGQVGMTFAESEERHFDAYSHILDILGLNDLFKQINEIPALRDRYNYLEKVMKKETNTPDEMAVKIILFTEFIEDVGLMAFFYIIMSFNRGRQTRFKGISNAVEATTKEEMIHAMFGRYLYDTLVEENPYIGQSTHIVEGLQQTVLKGYAAEMKILDWLFEEGDVEDVTKAEVHNFISGRFNNVAKSMGLTIEFETDPILDAKNMWFYEELEAPKEKDFFVKRPTDYTKGARSYDEDSLFD